MPIQRVPSRAPKSPKIRFDGSFLPSGEDHGSKREPSKRKRPEAVPIQMYPSAVCVIAYGRPLKNPSRAIQARWAYCEMRWSWASAQNGREHKGSSARIFKFTLEEDQRLERDCFPANISFQVVLFVGFWQVPKGVGRWPLLYDTIHCKSTREPQGLQAVGYRKLQEP